MFASNGRQSLSKEPKLAIGWVGLKYFGRSLFSREDKLILNNISGSIDFGSLNALMGPSGAGKSTLLKCINGRQKTSSDTKIYLSAERKIKACFVVQDISTHLLNGLTSLQSLVYASKLKNFKTDCDHKSNAQKLLSELMISDTESTAVEDCSGGERKRIVIAMELTAVKKPNVLCIDEPTSGLDSNAAEIVVQCLKSVSRIHNIAVVTSIHQPNNDLLMLFDNVYVLGKGGQCIYDGLPTDVRLHLCKGGIECNEFQVPIEVLLKIASERGSKFEEMVKQTEEKRNYLVQKCITEGIHSPNGVPLKKTSFNFHHFWYLLQRLVTYTLRSQWKSMVIQFIFIVSVIYLMSKFFNPHIGEPDGCFTFDNFYNTSDNTIEKLRIESLLSQNLRYQFFCEMLIQFLLIVAITLTFATEVRIFFNEQKNGWYSSGAYYLAKSVAEFPLCLVITVCYVAIAYTINQQIDEKHRFLGYMAISIGTIVCTQGIGFGLGILSNANDKLAIVLVIGVEMINVMLCGFFAPLDELPVGAKWLPHISFVKHGFENHLILIYGFDRCPAGQMQSILYQLNLMDETEKKFWTNVYEMSALIVIYRILALIALLLKANPINLRFNKLIAKKFKSENNNGQNGGMTTITIL